MEKRFFSRFMCVLVLLSLGGIFAIVQARTVLFMQAKLTASDGAADDQFGSSVSVSGNRAVVGAFNDDNGAGSAYLVHYQGTKWLEVDRLTDLELSLLSTASAQSTSEVPMEMRRRSTATLPE